MTGKALVCVLGEHIDIYRTQSQEINGQKVPVQVKADNIVRVDMCGETIITQRKNAPGTVGLLFDCETVLNEEFVSDHNMFRHSEKNRDKTTVGFFEDSARVRCIALFGQKCSAFFMPIEGMDSKWKCSNWKVGEQIDTVNGRVLCKKWVNQNAARRAQNAANAGAAKKNLVPAFKEHIDTDQLERNWQNISYDTVVINAKLHGTSCRCGNLPILQPTNWFKKFTNYWFGTKYKPEYNYGFVVGSRHVVKSVEGADHRNKDNKKTSYYNEDIWTKASKENFYGKLLKGETVYFEIVGYMPDGSPIMPGRETKALKKFLAKEEYDRWQTIYGDNLEFSYGCNPSSDDNKYAIYVYRITMSNEDGQSIDYSWDQLKARCEQLAVRYVPEICKIYPQGSKDGKDLRDWRDIIADVVNKENSGPVNKYFPLTPKEGVVVRQDHGGMIPRLYKSKCYEFKVLEGIIKETSIDLEESN